MNTQARPLRILFATSEALPLVKTGGLGDVSSALTLALQQQGCDIRLVLPAYPLAKQQLRGCRTLTTFRLPPLNQQITLLDGLLPEQNLTVWLIEQPELFDRPGQPYGDENGIDWPDNALRFATFCRAVARLSNGHSSQAWKPDLVHCNDWQTGLIPALLADIPQRPACLFTLHNLAYRGLFGYDTFQQLQLPAHWWSMHQLEFYGQFSFLKGGLVFADRLTTVSPTYAREILTEEFGHGLEGLLRARQSVLSGILNGIDDQRWNPATDKHLVRNFNARNLAGKAVNKCWLQAKLGLPVDADIPLLSLVSRLVNQKGIALLLDSLPALINQNIQLVILGTGEAHFEQALLKAGQEYPDKLAFVAGYNEPLSHQIFAATDIFLMPSLFEPCGLSQMYSLRYGALPVVRQTGGLADTVFDAADAETRASTQIQHQANGFVFQPATTKAFTDTVNRALTFIQDPSLWQTLQQHGMKQDFSWDASARAYLKLYHQCLAHPRFAGR